MNIITIWAGEEERDGCTHCKAGGQGAEHPLSGAGEAPQTGEAQEQTQVRIFID
jgi:hypothetical protein